MWIVTCCKFCLCFQVKSAIKKAQKKRKKPKSRKSAEGEGSRSQEAGNEEDADQVASQDNQAVDEEPMDGLRRLFRVGCVVPRIDSNPSSLISCAGYQRTDRRGRAKWRHGWRGKRYGDHWHRTCSWERQRHCWHRRARTGSTYIVASQLSNPFIILAEACNEWRDPSPPRRAVGDGVSNSIGPGIEAQTYAPIAVPVDQWAVSSTIHFLSSRRYTWVGVGPRNENHNMMRRTKIRNSVETMMRTQIQIIGKMRWILRGGFDSQLCCVLQLQMWGFVDVRPGSKEPKRGKLPTLCSGPWEQVLTCLRKTLVPPETAVPHQGVWRPTRLVASSTWIPGLCEETMLHLRMVSEGGRGILCRWVLRQGYARRWFSKAKFESSGFVGSALDMRTEAQTFDRLQPWTTGHVEMTWRCWFKLCVWDYRLFAYHIELKFAQ